MERQEYPVGKLTHVQTFEYVKDAPFCDFCLKENKCYNSDAMYRDEDNNGWCVCFDCEQELMMNGTIQ